MAIELINGIEIELQGGTRGLQGDKGDKGDPGNSFDPMIGDVETLSPGSQATVTTNVDEEGNILYFNFGIPKGDKGDTGGANFTTFDIIDGKLIAYPENPEEQPIVLGTVAMETKGEYDSSIYYEKLNIVEYNDSTYVATKPSNNVLPTDTEYWQLIGGGLRREDIVDNLDSNDATKMLSAKQGKVLNEGKVQAFDTVALMKAATLKNGMTVQTLGYYAANDGGGATYYITNTFSATDYQEELDNGKYASLIIEDSTINVKQIGAYGDNTHDDSTKINEALLFAYNNNKNIFIPEGTYLITNTLYFYGNQNSSYPAIIIKGAGRTKTTFKSYNNSTNIIEIKPYGDNSTTNQLYISDFTIDGNNSSTNGIEIKGDNFTHSRLENIKIINCTNAGITNETDKPNVYLDSFIRILVMYCGTGIKLQNGTNTSLRIADCYVYGCNNGYRLKAVYSTMENCCADAITDTVFYFTDFIGTCISPGAESPNALKVFDFNRAYITIINPFTFGNFTNENSIHINALTATNVIFINGKIMTNQSGEIVTDNPALGKLYQCGQGSNVYFYGTRYSSFTLNNSYESDNNSYKYTSKNYGEVFQRYSGNGLAFIGMDTRTSSGLIDNNNLGSTVSANAIYFGLGDTPRYGFDGADYRWKTFNMKGDILLSKNPEKIGGIGWVQSEQLTTGNWTSGTFLKIPVYMADTTTNRPTTNLVAGQMFFDTTLGKPIWYDGSNWKDATGTTV